jgi:hypothetical protein
MYRIVKESFGFQITFGDTLSPDEMRQWRMESVRALVGAPRIFGVIFDMRTLRLNEMDQEAQEMIAEGRELYKRAGMRRSCVILDSASLIGKYRRRARETRDWYFERYINAAEDRFWRTKALGWIEENLDPDL